MSVRVFSSDKKIEGNAVGEELTKMIEDWVLSNKNVGFGISISDTGLAVSESGVVITVTYTKYNINR